MIGASLLIVASVIGCAFGGSPCPPRNEIYPCSCISVQMSKKISYTIIWCQGLSNSASLAAIFPKLRIMQIDRFCLYDSFWEARDQNLADEERMLPPDWFNLLWIKEMEVVDTPLSSNFACASSQICSTNDVNCRNSEMVSFTMQNSSSSEKIFSMCSSQRGDKYPWLGHLSKLEHFHVTKGKLGVVRRSFFPVPMSQLTHLNLTNNMIQKVDPDAFANLTSLMSLDLSHNAIGNVSNVFKGLKKLEFLDLSFNFLMFLSPDLFPSLPLLKTLNVNNNKMVDLRESDWEAFPENLRIINLRDNRIDCQCNIAWINSTFPSKITLDGWCETPPNYKKNSLRYRAKFLAERCDENGNFIPKKKSTVNA